MKQSRRKFIKQGLLWTPAAVAGLNLLLPRKSQAAVTIVSGRRSTTAIAGGGGGCATADHGTFDEMLYGWESSEVSLGTWTGPTNVNDGDSATFTTNYDTSALSTGKPTGACNVGLRCVVTGANAFDAYRFARGSAIAAGTANVDFRFYVYIQTILSGTGRIPIMVAGQGVDPSGGLVFSVEWRDDGGGVNEVRASATTDSAWLALTANSWNKIHVHVDATNTNSTIAVNDGGAQTFSSSATNALQYAYVGACFAGAGAAGTLVFDLLAINTP